jgi:hypothetical protein
VSHFANSIGFHDSKKNSTAYLGVVSVLCKVYIRSFNDELFIYQVCSYPNLKDQAKVGEELSGPGRLMKSIVITLND